MHSPPDTEAKRNLLVQEFLAASESLDIIGIYSYFYVNCAQKVYRELAASSLAAAQTFYTDLLAALSLTLTSRASMNRVFFEFENTMQKDD